MTARASLGALLVTLAVLLAGCSRKLEDCPPVPSAQPVDSVLLAFLSRARAAHHAADRAEQAGDPARALRLLDELVRGPIPGAAAPPVEAREVLADTRARLADLSSQSSDFDAADAHLRAGLELVPDTGYFRGHLFEVRGVVEERRAKALAAKGDAQGAAAANQRALDALEQAMAIQADVIRGATPASDAGPP